jgi:NADH-quinone oxidoreductase subunit L
MIFLTFYGELKTHPAFLPGKIMTVPLIILAVLSVFGGFIELPASMGKIHLFSGIVENALPAVITKNIDHLELFFQLLSSLVALAGIYLAFLIYLRKPLLSESFNHSKLNRFFEKGWGFDAVYNKIFVKPVVWLSEIDKNDFFDTFNIGLSRFALFLNRILSIAQNGNLRWYLISLAIGIAVILTYLLS